MVGKEPVMDLEVAAIEANRMIKFFRALEYTREVINTARAAQSTQQGLELNIEQLRDQLATASAELLEAREGYEKDVEKMRVDTAHTRAALDQEINFLRIALDVKSAEVDTETVRLNNFITSKQGEADCISGALKQEITTLTATRDDLQISIDAIKRKAGSM